MYILTIYQYRSNFCIHSLNLDFELYATTLDPSEIDTQQSELQAKHFLLQCVLLFQNL
ncbi:unnamed protein product [Callosobruchus maculatus]|uniref:Uncharacterized protein n=1 Tax=Callosobruchus maculatus TaxID=64391 RepID=A0A653D2U5_CALMS|nr:unnamed protein product [Callosobruchus maculatus]